MGLSCSNWGFQTHYPVAHHGDALLHGDALVHGGGTTITKDEDDSDHEDGSDFDIEDLELANVHRIIDDLAEELRPYGQPLYNAEAAKAAEDNVGTVLAQVARIFPDRETAIYSRNNVQQWIREALTKSVPSNSPLANELELPEPSCNAEKIFNNLLRLSFSLSDGNGIRPYQDFLLDHGSQLFGIVKNVIHDDVWENFVQGDKTFDRDFLR